MLPNHFFAFFMSLLTILSEILVISLSGVPFSPQQIYIELLVCGYTSMGILACMAVGLIRLWWWRRGGPSMPRDGNTVMGVMSFVCGSRMLDDFEGFEWLGGRELEKRVSGVGKRYGFGRWKGVDRRWRWMVEEAGIIY
jgi:hypothetical protein